jgi:FtsZ-binding cell division protein ZapB
MAEKRKKGLVNQTLSKIKKSVDDVVMDLSLLPKETQELIKEVRALRRKNDFLEEENQKLKELIIETISRLKVQNESTDHFIKKLIKQQ